MSADFEGSEVRMGAAIRWLREQRGWSQAHLSERLANVHWPLHQTNISKLEAGKRPIRIADLAALGEVFGVPISAFWFLPPTTSEQRLARAAEAARAAREFLAAVERQAELQSEVEGLVVRLVARGDVT